jgi:hypothetical protein
MAQPNRTDPDKHADQMRRGAKARNDARAELVRRHRAEYDEIHAEMAAKHDVKPHPEKFKSVAQTES